MTATLRRNALLATLLGVWSTLASGSASAQSCSSDAECSTGYSCRLFKEIYCRGGGCQYTPRDGGSDAGRAGAGGTTGLPDESDEDAGYSCDPEPVTCEAQTWGYCDRPTCASDADCLPGMTCFEEPTVDCQVEDPCPGQDRCPVDPGAYQSQCSTVMRKTCEPPTRLACATDTDCGAGFECVEGGGVICTCPAGMGGTSGDEDAGPPAGGCTCHETNRCALRETACSTAADCPASFSCEDNPCTRCASGGAPYRDGGTAGSTGYVGGCQPEPAGPPRMCKPPAYYGDFGCSYYPGPMHGGAGASANTDGGVPYHADAGAALAGRASGASGAGGSTSGAAGPAPSSDEDDEDDEDGHHRFPHLRRLLGCSAAPTGPGDALGSFGLIALAVLGIRRRARRA